MTWRRFAALLRNLPPDSAWVRLAHSQGKKPRLVTDEAEAIRIFDAIR